MKYKVGDKTLLGEIDRYEENSRYCYLVEKKWWLTESDVDKIIIKPKRNIDHIIELLEDGKEEQARKFYNELVPLSEGYAVADEIYYFLKPYTEPSKYPKLTPNELQAVKWLVDGGFYQIEYLGCIGANITENKNAFLQIDNLPFCGCLGHTSWMTEKPINLKELLDAQEENT
jgi:hypothetical protein